MCYLVWYSLKKLIIHLLFIYGRSKVIVWYFFNILMIESCLWVTNSHKLTRHICIYIYIYIYTFHGSVSVSQIQ
jgi:hypothetical protein